MAWQSAMRRASARPRTLVKFTLASLTFKVLDGPSDVFSYDQAVIRTDAIGSKLDPVTREVKVDAIDVSLAYPWAAPLVASSRFLNQRVDIYLGEQSLQESDYLLIFSGRVEDILPEPSRGPIVFQCESLLSLIEVAGQVTLFDYHPLEAAEELLTLAKNVPPGMINGPSFDPSDPTYASFGHLVCNRGDPFLAYEASEARPVPFTELMNNLMQMIQGSLVVDDTGRITFRLFTSTADEEWTEDDIIELSQEGESGIINRVTVNIASSPVYRTELTKEGYNKVIVDAVDGIYTQDETASQTAMLYPGTVQGVFEREINLFWQAGNRAFLAADINSVDTTVVVRGRGFGRAFAGSHWPSYPAAQQSWATLSASRPAYLMIDNEIVKSVVAPTPADDKLSIEMNPLSGFLIVKPRMDTLTYTVTRGELGTTPVPHVGDGVVGTVDPHTVRDVTSAKQIADYILGRFAYGQPRIAVKTSLHKAHIQQGDIIAITHPDYISYGVVGLDNTTTWEVTRREINVADGVVEFEMVQASAPARTYGYNARLAYYDTHEKQYHRSVINDQAFRPHLLNPVSVTHVSGTTIRLGELDLSSADRKIKISQTVDKTLNASKETYIWIDMFEGAYAFREKSLGTPVMRSNFAPIAIVTTDATTVTDIDTSMQPLTGLDAEKVIEFTVTGGKVADETIGVVNMSPFEARDIVNKNSDFSSATRDINTRFPDGWQESSSPGSPPGGSWQTYTFPRSGGESGGRYIEMQRFSDGGGTGTNVMMSDYFPLANEILYTAELVVRGNDGVSTARAQLFTYDENLFSVGGYLLLDWATPAGVWTTRKVYDYFVNATGANARYGRILIANYESITNPGFVLDVDKIKVTRAQQSFRVAQTGPAQSIPASTITAVTMQTTLFDHTRITIGGPPVEYGFQFSPPKTRYTILQPGEYLFAAGAAFSTLNPGAEFEVGFLLNGVTYTSGTRVASSALGAVVRAQVRDTMPLVRGDYVETYVWHNDSGPKSLVTGTASTYFCGSRKID